MGCFYWSVESKFHNRIIFWLFGNVRSAFIYFVFSLIFLNCNFLLNCNIVVRAAGISVAFTNESARKCFEKNAPSTADRINAFGKMKEAGIKTYTLICPVIPYSTDVESLLDLVAPCSDEIWVYKLEINAVTDLNWQQLQSVLGLCYPHLFGKIREVAFSPNHGYWRKTRKFLENMQSKFGSNIIIQV